MTFQSKEIVKRLRREYPAGTRVELIKMDDFQAPPIGTLGTVVGVDDTGSIMVRWDSGSSLSVVYGQDRCRKLAIEEPQAVDEVFDDLYFARFRPWEDCSVLTPEMHKVSATMDEKYKLLEAMLDTEGKKTLGDLMSDRAVLESLLLVQTFKSGFRYGAKLMIATLYENDGKPTQADSKPDSR